MADQNPSPLTTPTSDANLEQAVGEYGNIMNNYSYVTGGPNQGLIDALTQQSKQKAQQYKQNRADAANMYGQLTQTVDEGIQTVQRGYNTAIQESSQSALGATSALGNQLQQQVAQRQKTANELGIGKQSAMTPYESDVRGNEAMANIMASNQNWTNLLRSQQQAAQQQGVDTKTALGQSKNLTMMALKEALEAGQGNIAAQIAAERGKVGTPQLTPLGDILMGGLKTKLQGIMNPPENTGAKNLRTGINAVMTDPTINTMFGNPDLSSVEKQTEWYNSFVNQLQTAYSNEGWKNGTRLGAQLQLFAELFGLPAPYIQDVQGVTNPTSYVDSRYGNS